MPIEPYLFFEGRAEEALEFYRAALGAEVTTMMRFRENPEPGHNPPGAEDKLMHASFSVGGSTVMLSDGRCAGAARFDGFALSLIPPDEATARRWFAALAEGGTPIMPLAKTFWSPCFGMAKDRFGVTWMINLQG